MPADVISIVSLSIGVAQLTSGPLAKKYLKGAAQKACTDVVQKYSEIKRLREDVDQYFTEDERVSLDATLEQITFHLMTLENALQKFKGIAYWKLLTYHGGLQSIKQETKEVLAQLVIIHKEIMERSTQGRKHAKSGGTGASAVNRTMTASDNNHSDPDPPLASPQSTLNAIFNGQTQLDFTPTDNINDNQAHREIMASMMQATASAVRSSGVLTYSQVNSLANVTTPIEFPPRALQSVSRPISLRRSATTPGALPRWHIEPKSTSTPASLSSTLDVELNTLREDID